MFVLKFGLHFWSPSLILNVLDKNAGSHILCVSKFVERERRAYVNV